MKVMKKISAILLSLCLLVPCFSMVADAADGRISFTDPTTAVGEYVEVRCVLRSTSGNMNAVKVTLSYDESYLRFDSGDSIEAGESGELICAGTATSAEASFVAKFQALQEGTTKVEIVSSEISDANSATLTLDHGNSTVTIEAGDPSKIEDTDSTEVSAAEDMQVDIDGVSYTLTDDFADADIPNGYARTQRTLDGVERQMVENETGGVCLAYMINEEGTGDFFLYNEENASFSPYAEIPISDVASIIVLSDASQVSLPSQYKEAKLSLNEKEFPVWQDTENEGFYILYAMNNDGEEGFYQYDSAEGTYQKMDFETEEVEEEEESETTGASVVDKIVSFVEGHLMLVLLIVGVCGVLGLLILIILAVKLHNRNAELDELYNQYGIGYEEEEVKPVKSAKKEKKAKRKKEDDFEEEEFEEVEFEENDFEEVEFEEAEFEEAEFEEAEFEENDFEEVSLKEVDFEEEEFEEFKTVKNVRPIEEEFTGYTERMDFTIDDLDELLGEKKEKKLGHMEEDDTFKIDFIDLD